MQVSTIQIVWRNKYWMEKPKYVLIMNSIYTLHMSIYIVYNM